MQNPTHHFSEVYDQPPMKPTMMNIFATNTFLRSASLQHKQLASMTKKDVLGR